ncbi:hypothetical protein [Paenibacillus beijingensis]|uniref:Uncharacterized protein n=1 Tax=Paenibacillus beijingensis TaxID=1126833 RepID=A0A0D5NG36_9BACL|nr:hypothetical protein [Paenibacillus beijingensis]AJY73937.1 hypothetical protein VN24_04070 [Paenibacillus beijingensis]
MSERCDNPGREGCLDDMKNEGREQYELDIDRMVNEGLGGGQVTYDNGLIEETTTDTIGAGKDLQQP